MPLLTTGSIRTHVQILGQGRPIVMIHGLLVGSLAEWYFTAAPRLARGARVILYDLRGHGRSERARSGYELATLASDLSALLRSIPVAEPLDLVGHSYGGLVALRFALDSPEMVRRLALVDVPLPPTLLGEMSNLDTSGVEKLVASLPAPLRDAIGGGGRRARRLLESLRFLAQESTLFADMKREKDFSDEEIGRLAMPVLGLFGAASRCLPAGERLARIVPGAAVTILPGGHFLPLECPARVTGELETFLLG